MSAALQQQQNKRKKIGSGAREDGDDDDVVLVAVNGMKKPSTETQHQQQQQQQQSSKKKAEKKLSSVYLVFRCEVPVGKNLENVAKDTEVIGVFVNRRDANECAKVEAYLDEYEDKVEADNSDDNGRLFEWEDDQPCGWFADRVWVERKPLEYSYEV
mmetsp:Transcript_45818/g.111732  ORF Transcript_45818/g.111732 Transcript_45818/m.111732 type:complete len:157 (+) Transcript_45818:111-581(+)|eukprot:CAMPEP_0113468592 /NCGR_PEP_ID=MMETSP0014_2-20120614/15441_1 /TAXON_ID=2857 /ORGANISM="Nitzschia sp." /LENGTH=156 /DNA_ID=CAMNT_0000360999 /DNA_START=111 /DNA_END=581 /DNA_ORIENTATION=- /assembly_acc=CAM_ASM_000159